MNRSSAWIYLVLGGIALYVLWGIHVDATITVPEEEIRVTYHPSSPATTEGDAINAAFVDSLPLYDPYR